MVGWGWPGVGWSIAGPDRIGSQSGLPSAGRRAILRRASTGAGSGARRKQIKDQGEKNNGMQTREEQPDRIATYRCSFSLYFIVGFLTDFLLCNTGNNFCTVSVHAYSWQCSQCKNVNSFMYDNFVFVPLIRVAPALCCSVYADLISISSAYSSSSSRPAADRCIAKFRYEIESGGSTLILILGIGILIVTKR